MRSSHRLLTALHLSSAPRAAAWLCAALVSSASFSCGKSSDGRPGADGGAGVGDLDGDVSAEGAGWTADSAEAAGDEGRSTDADAAADAGEPVDRRPPAPAWTPPVPLGSPGWLQSDKPLCENYRGDYTSYDLWADARGVFALFAVACQNLDGSGLCTGEGTTLQQNDGSGWKTLFWTPTPVYALRGIPGGPLVILGDPLAANCSLRLIDESGAFSCAAEPHELWPDLEPDDAWTELYGAGPDLAYAFQTRIGTGTTHVAMRSGGTMSAIGTLPMTAYAIWGDAQTVVVVGENQSVYLKSGSETFAQVPGVPAGTYYAVWATGPNDLWLINRVGQVVHYNGTAWTVVSPGVGAIGLPARIWGSATDVYFSTTASFARWHGSTFETLIDAGTKANAVVRGLAARSPSEVFVGFHDPAFDQYGCGGEFVLWFDGTEFHRF